MPRSTIRSKTQILATAEHQLRESGAGSITVDGIARAAGCAKGLVHYHFNTKNELLAAAAQAMFGRRRERWAEALKVPSFDIAVRNTWALLKTEAAEGVTRSWTSLLTHDTQLTGRSVNNMFGVFSETLGEGLEKLIAAAGLESTAPLREVARLLAAGVYGLELQLAAGGAADDLEGAYEALWLGILSLTRPSLGNEPRVMRR